jgi:hypothetical protein
VAAAVVVVAALKLSMCNMFWGCLPLARDSGCERFDSDWCFTSAKCGSSISAGFGVQAICFCIIVTILDHFLIVILK